MITNKQKMCLVGKDISHSQSPMLYNEFFQTHNINMEYFLCEIKDEKALTTFIDETKNNKNNIVAFNITYPYKNIIIKYIDELDDSSKLCNSANLVIKKDNRLIGYNTDGAGLYNFLLSQNFDITNKNILLIGFGGAGTSIYNTMKNNGAKNIIVINHSLSKKFFEKEETLIPCSLDLIINASNAGFNTDNSLPIPTYLIDKIIHNNIFCVDIIYNPKETAFLKYLHKKNIPHIFNGEGMLKYQFYENIKILGY